MRPLSRSQETPRLPLIFVGQLFQCMVCGDRATDTNPRPRFEIQKTSDFGLSAWLGRAVGFGGRGGGARGGDRATKSLPP
ncbi:MULTISPECIES: hypothetical protein [Trichocoleus]|uniref:Uncharacterized protein n=1 Tax=Trichocoleus desertorum GB2-A4 TaxID=2933944 RepID=A0ABV0JCR9_9CYAN|nr:hypothetical protein [Trichocoleus sp. FACHB-46]MBD1864223.1 hypothetical protein [Trichocoleus sp. FACHB-46]